MQKSVVDGGDSRYPIAAQCLHHVCAPLASYLVGVFGLDFQFRLKGRPVVRGEIALADVLETGRLEEIGVSPAAERHMGWARSERPPVEDSGKARRRMDDIEGHASAGAKNASALVQHGELRPQATQNVRVHNGIEARRGEGKARPICAYRHGSRAEAGSSGAGSSLAHIALGNVDREHTTACLGGEVQAWPARAGTEIE